MALNHVTLDDKYDLAKSRIFVTGFQALVRLCLMQKERDRRAGTQHRRLRHRLSRLAARRPRPAVHPRAERSLDKYDILFQAGINEDLAATALWGSQQAELRGEGKFDGVFGIWYGKGPGVDRTGDVFRHANFAGTSKHGGVLALMGDDHTAESSTTAHQSEYHFVDVMIPILNPAGVQEILDYGLYGWAMSRFCGTWVGAQVHARDGRVDRRDRRQPRPRQDRHPGTTSQHAGRRPQHPPARHHPRPGSAAARLQARRHARLRARQQAQQATSPRAGASRRSASSPSARAISTCARRSTSSASTRSSATIFGIRLYKIGCPWPISQQRSQGVRRRARADHRGRGEALADRSAGARGALRHRQPAGLHRQEGRAGQLAVPGQGRARSQRRRDLHRRAHPAARRPERGDRGDASRG